MHDRDLAEINAALCILLKENLGIRRGRTLEAKLRHAGRRLPRRARRAGRRLAEAERLWANPKLRVRLDPDRLAADERRLRAFLFEVDPADRRRGAILGVLVSLAVNALVIAGGVIGWLAVSGRL